MPDDVTGWLLIGVIAGVLGKLIMPGRDPGGFIVTILLGIAGALLAGLVSQAAGLERQGAFATYASATAGAVLLLIIYRLIMRTRTR